MVTQFKPANRFSPKISLAAAAVEWQGLQAEQQELVIIDEKGLPYLTGVPELTERAEALLDAVHGRLIKGLVCNEDGYSLHPENMQLNRESVTAWIQKMEKLPEPQPVAVMPACPASAQEVERLVDLNQVLKLLNISRSTLHRLRKDQTFPQPEHENPLRWRLSVVQGYINKLPTFEDRQLVNAEEDIGKLHS